MSGFQPRTMSVTLYEGDFQQRLDDAKTAADRAEKAWQEAKRDDADHDKPRLLIEQTHAGRLREVFEKLAQEHDALLDEADQHSVRVTMRALGRKKYGELVRDNPPRTDESVPEEIRKGDENLGVNDESFGEALVPACIAGISDPDLHVDELLDAISSIQFQQLYAVAFALNRGSGSDPKAAPRLTPSLSSSETES